MMLNIFVLATLCSLYWLCVSATNYNGWSRHPEFDDKDELAEDPIFQNPDIQVEWDANFDNGNEDLPQDFHDSVEDFAVIDYADRRRLRDSRQLLSPEEMNSQILGGLNDLRRAVGVPEDLEPVLIQGSEAGTQTFSCDQKLPTASNMRELEWDQGLADLAATHAQSCHNARNGDEAVKELGQLRFLQYSASAPGADFASSALDKWARQEAFYNYRRSRCQGGPCASFVQAVRDRAARVGCAVHRCAAVSGPGGRARAANYLVCYLDRRGKFHRPYRAGRQCALCGGACQDGLCQQAPQIYRACEDYEGPFPVCRIRWNGVLHETCDSLWTQAGAGACTSPWVREYYCRLRCGTCDPEDFDPAATDVCGTAAPRPDPCSEKRTWRACHRVKKGKYIRLCNWKRVGRRCEMRKNLPYLTGL